MHKVDIKNAQQELAARTEITRNMKYGELYDFLQNIRNASMGDDENRLLEGLIRALDSAASLASDNYQDKPYPTAEELIDKMNEHGGMDQLARWVSHRQQGAIANAKYVEPKTEFLPRRQSE